MAETKVAPQTSTKLKPKDPDPPRQWNVVLIDDDEHTFEYVIDMLQKLFGFTPEKGKRVAQAVNDDGRAVCMTTHKEHAELKRDQILTFGKDFYATSSSGSMTAIIEPAVFGGDGDDAGGDKKA